MTEYPAPEPCDFINYDRQDLKTAIRLGWDCIEHWHSNFFAEEDAEIYGDHCAYCNEYYSEDLWEDVCEGCPVYALTGLDDCAKTPWRRVRRAYIAVASSKTDAISKLRFAIANQIEFLVDIQFAMIERLREIENEATE